MLDALVAELNARRGRGEGTPEAVRLIERAATPLDLEIADVEAGNAEALRLLAADWVLVSRAHIPRVARFLPADLLAVAGHEATSPLACRSRHWMQANGRLSPPVPEGRMRHDHVAALLAAQQEFFREESWAKQIAWRLGRVHQLSTARNDGNRRKRQAEADALLPAAAPFSGWVPAAVDAIRDVGVRSVIEALRVRRLEHRVRRPSALTDAVPQEVWDERSVLLAHQHRMHPDISALPRELFYDRAALLDANTIEGRDARLGWAFLEGAPGRRVWLDVEGVEERGVNHGEIDAMARLLAAWRDSEATRPRRDGRPWEVACLSFYNRQELAVRDMLRKLTGQPRAETRFELSRTTLSCSTVDRFQGREADVVLLSLRNTRRPGHLDSPNRLNVAITRARFLLVIVGHRRYFAERCPSEELTALAERTPILRMQSRA